MKKILAFTFSFTLAFAFGAAVNGTLQAQTSTAKPAST